MLDLFSNLNGALTGRAFATSSAARFYMHPLKSPATNIAGYRLRDTSM